jgi:flagellar motor component MotA
MDAATIIGLILGLGCILIALMQSDAGLSAVSTPTLICGIPMGWQ